MASYCFTVKNTFIDIQEVGTLSQQSQPRCSSVPRSVRLCRDEVAISSCEGKLSMLVPVPLSFHQSDVSTDAHTEDSQCSESGHKTSGSGSMDDWCTEASPASTVCAPCDSMKPPGVFFQSPTPHTSLGGQRQALSAKAAAYQPQAVAEDPDPDVKNYEIGFAEVVTQAWHTLSNSDDIASAEITGDASGWTLTIKPCGGDEWQTDSMMTLAKEALLAAAADSKNIYVMGYCAPKPFTVSAQGFHATLGAMENASAACWHYFKKGFCRHGDKCRTEHPICQVPVQVFVESAHFDSQPRTISEFVNEVENLATTVSAALEECAHCFQVETYKAIDGQGWTVEVTPREECQAHSEYLLSVAKSTLFSDSNSSNSVYIMGYGVKPFISKSEGFVTMVGNMRDPSKACWDMYSKAKCTRDCICKWEHPTCYMPINVVMKKAASTTCVAR